MHRPSFVLLRFVRLLAISIFGAFLVIVRYLLKTPQPLESILPGEAHLFKWTHSHIFYKVHGEADAPPLVLLHTPQIGGSAYEFRGLVEQLAQHYRVYALDLLGFGLSDHPNIHYSGETYTTLYQDFLTQVVQQPAILVASALSCNYSIAVASAYPELCQRLVLISPGILFAEGKRQNAISRLLQQPLVGLFVYALLTMRLVLRELLARQKQERVVAENELDYIYASAHQLGAQYAAIALLSGQLLLDVSQHIETLTTPILVLWGVKAFSADWSIAELYSLNDQVQGVMIQGAGLRPHEEQPAEVVAQLMQWYTPESPTQSIGILPTRVAPTPVIVHEEISIPATEIGITSDAGLGEQSYTKEYQEELVKESMMEDKQVEAYCVKCKEKRIMRNPVDTVTKNGRSAKTGTCPVCGTKLFRFVAG